MPRKKKQADPIPETPNPILQDRPFPDLPPPPPLPEKSPYNSTLRRESENTIKEFDKEFEELSEEEIAEDFRKHLWGHRKMLIDRMLHFAQQDQNAQVAERTTSKLIERIYGKIPTTKVELGDEERGLAVTMHSDVFTREDDIPDGSSKPEGFDELDEDEAALVQEDAAIPEAEDDDEEDDFDEEDEE